MGLTLEDIALSIPSERSRNEDRLDGETEQKWREYEE